MNISEILARASIPVFINSFNQFTYLRDLVNILLSNQFRNLWILDNKSTHPSLLEFYRIATEKYKGVVNVLYYKENYGPHYFHASDFYKSVWNCPHFYTDPDLSFESIHPDFVQSLINTSIRYKIAKVGVALTIPSEGDMVDVKRAMPETGNIPVSVRDWEKQFWVKKIEPNIYDASVDTTFHYFNPLFFDKRTFYRGIRIAGVGFEAKHRPWFKSALCPIEERNFYKASATGGHGGWV
jgi:hypothetical protein